MDTVTSAAKASEAEAFLAEHPQITGIELVMPDNNGIVRGKRLAREGLLKLFEEGVRMPGSLFALDSTGADVPEAGLQFDQGDPDRICWPVAGTLRAVPWHARPLGQVLLTMHEEDGRPFFADPRQVLAGILERYRARGMTPVVAVELEFYLIDKQLMPDGRPLPPVSPATGQRESGVQAYSMAAMSEFDEFFANVEAAALAQGLPADAAVSEAAPGQYEINLKHSPDAVAAADHGVLLKRLIKGVAADVGFDATFMAKPFATEAGNGMHIHMSLLDDKGRNLFDDRSDRGSDMMRHALGGLMGTMSESMALLAPNANSFRRFQEGSYAPTAATWAYNNRTTSLRIPSGGGSARRIEHRVAGADANVYLVVAAVLAGALHGIEQRIDPGPPITGNAYEKAERSLPDTWSDALVVFDEARILRGYFGEDFCKVYSECRWAERRKFQSVVSSLEYEWYLRAV
jgi:glutamine synthetase